MFVELNEWRAAILRPVQCAVDEETGGETRELLFIEFAS